MGAAASIHATEALSTTLQGMLSKGRQQLQQLGAAEVDSDSEMVNLMMLKLGLLQNNKDSNDLNETKQEAEAKLLEELMLLSRGEEMSGETQVVTVEVNSLEDLEELKQDLTVTDTDTQAPLFMVTSESSGSPELLTSLSSIFSNHMHQLKGLNIANNGVEDEVLATLCILKSPHLVSLSAGGNFIEQNFAISISHCSHLVILDLSFTENLVISSALGTVCPRLLRLVLDGCSVKSTVVESSSSSSSSSSYPPEEVTGTNESSIFYGLVQLEELSLKENLLEDVASLRGLSFFGFEGKYRDILAPTLKSLWLTDNPLMEVTAMRKGMEEYVMSTLPFVSELNGMGMDSYNGGKVVIAGDLSGVLQRDGDGGSRAVGGQEGFENMDKEYLAALKGERDVTVVS